jgi:hypothetical protein
MDLPIGNGQAWQETRIVMNGFPEYDKYDHSQKER